MLAALGCHTDCVHILLEKGAKADTGDKKGFTALHRAVCVLALLVCVRLHIPALFKYFINAEYDSFTASLMFQECLFSHVITSSVLTLQAMLGSSDCVSALLEHGASALCRDSQGRTPLHLAASRGHTELLHSLLQAALKADPLDSMLDYRGYTPVHWAAYHGETPEQELIQSTNQMYFQSCR